MENMSEESAGEGETSQVKQQCSIYISGYRVPAVFITVVRIIIIVKILSASSQYELVVFDELEIV